MNISKAGRGTGAALVRQIAWIDESCRFTSAW